MFKNQEPSFPFPQSSRRNWARRRGCTESKDEESLMSLPKIKQETRTREDEETNTNKSETKTQKLRIKWDVKTKTRDNKTNQKNTGHETGTTVMFHPSLCEWNHTYCSVSCQAAGCLWEVTVKPNRRFKWLRNTNMYTWCKCICALLYLRVFC